jgi:hypothetical protein
MEYLWPIIVASFWGPMLLHFKKSNEILETWSPLWKNLAFEDPPSLNFHNRTDTTLHVLWQVSFGCWVTWSISSWQNYYKSVFFTKDEWWIVDLLFLSLNNWGLNFLQNERFQSSQIYLSPEKLRKMFTFQSCKFLNDKIDQNIKSAIQKQPWEKKTLL